jgi:hypothetical protein
MVVKKKLVEELIGDGTRLLRQLDGQNFPVESMFWVHLPDEDYWRLVIASPLVNQQGGAAGYRRLNELLRQIELAGITLEDISLLDPESSQFQSLRSLAGGSSRLAAGPEWLELEEAVVYRWTGASASAELTCDVSSIELNQLWDAERKLSNLPALLITSNKRRVTLRFHPQHGSLQGIENVKRPFQIALHRPEARPDCQVRWLN